MQPPSDARLLREYARQGSETAFAEIVIRYTDLVYSAALRQVDSPDLAQDVGQTVFTDLARKAEAVSGKLTEDGSLVGWLYRATQFTALSLRRGEHRRQERERQAMDEFLPETAEPPPWSEVQPLLDEALAELNEADREALLLRFFKNENLRAVGLALGISDDTAQKRVNRAVERLRQTLSKRGVTAGAGALIAVISANAVQAAPAGLAATFSAAAGLSGTTLTTTAILTKTIAMTTLQKIIVGTTIALVIGGGIYEARQASQWRDEAQSLRQQHTLLASQIQELQHERDEATNRYALLASEPARAASNNLELLKLRSEVSRLRNEANSAGDATQSAAKAWVTRVAQLRERLHQKPEAGIPELNLLEEEDWLAAVKDRKLDTEGQYRRALSTLRANAESKFASATLQALQKYLAANGNQFPADVTQLKSYFDTPMDDAIFQRWQIVSAKTVPGVGVGDQVITQKAAVDDLLDMRDAVGKNGHGSMDFLDSETRNVLTPLFSAYARANSGNWAGFDKSKLLPYATTPEQQTAIQKIIDQDALRKN